MLPLHKLSSHHKELHALTLETLYGRPDAFQYIHKRHHVRLTQRVQVRLTIIPHAEFKSLWNVYTGIINEADGQIPHVTPRVRNGKLINHEEVDARRSRLVERTSIMMNSQVFQSHVTTYNTEIARLISCARSLNHPHITFKFPGTRTTFLLANGLRKVEIVATLTDQERLDSLLSQHAPSEIDWRTTESIPEDYHAG